MKSEEYVSIPVEEFEELSRKAKLFDQATISRCRCGKWKTYFGNYDEDGFTLRCSGCLRAVHRCTC
jgi:hypothetical protein